MQFKPMLFKGQHSIAEHFSKTVPISLPVYPKECQEYT